MQSLITAGSVPSWHSGGHSRGYRWGGRVNDRSPYFALVASDNSNPFMTAYGASYEIQSILKILKGKCYI